MFNLHPLWPHKRSARNQTGVGRATRQTATRRRVGLPPPLSLPELPGTMAANAATASALPTEDAMLEPSALPKLEAEVRGNFAGRAPSCRQRLSAPSCANRGPGGKSNKLVPPVCALFFVFPRPPQVMSSSAASEVVLRAVLKQYAFSPKLVKMEVVHRALIKVRTSMHAVCGAARGPGTLPHRETGSSSEQRQSH